MRTKPEPECVDNQALSLCLSTTIVGYLFSQGDSPSEMAKLMLRDGLRRLPGVARGHATQRLHRRGQFVHGLRERSRRPVGGRGARTHHRSQRPAVRAAGCTGRSAGQRPAHGGSLLYAGWPAAAVGQLRLPVRRPIHPCLRRPQDRRADLPPGAGDRVHLDVRHRDRLGVRRSGLDADLVARRRRRRRFPTDADAGSAKTTDGTGTSRWPAELW